MRLFIGYSSKKGEEIAKRLGNWFRFVNRNITPFVKHIHVFAGENTDSVVQSALRRAHFGILCITNEDIENLSAITSLASKLEVYTQNNNPNQQPHVAPLLFGVESDRIPDSIRPFQYAFYERSGIWEIFYATNEVCYQLALDEVLKSQNLEILSANFLAGEELVDSFQRLYKILQDSLSEVLTPAVQTQPQTQDDFKSLLVKIRQDPAFPYPKLKKQLLDLDRCFQRIGDDGGGAYLAEYRKLLKDCIDTLDSIGPPQADSGSDASVLQSLYQTLQNRMGFPTAPESDGQRTAPLEGSMYGDRTGRGGIL